MLRVLALSLESASRPSNPSNHRLGSRYHPKCTKSEKESEHVLRVDFERERERETNTHTDTLDHNWHPVTGSASITISSYFIHVGRKNRTDLLGGIDDSCRASILNQSVHRSTGGSPTISVEEHRPSPNTVLEGPVGRGNRNPEHPWDWIFYPHGWFRNVLMNVTIFEKLIKWTVRERSAVQVEIWLHGTR